MNLNPDNVTCNVLSRYVGSQKSAQKVSHIIWTALGLGSRLLVIKIRIMSTNVSLGRESKISSKSVTYYLKGLSYFRTWWRHQLHRRKVEQLQGVVKWSRAWTKWRHVAVVNKARQDFWISFRKKIISIWQGSVKYGQWWSSFFIHRIVVFNTSFNFCL